LNVFIRDQFYFSMSSKAELSILALAVSSHAFVPIVLHMDAMYKLNLNKFLILILGLSDAQQQFHLPSISILYQEGSVLGGLSYV
jgi:hypothetical protein